jgi:hypothetical protein
MENSINQISKISIESLTNRLNQVKNRISWLENMVHELEHSDKDNEKNKVWKEQVKPSGYH